MINRIIPRTNKKINSGLLKKVGIDRDMLSVFGSFPDVFIPNPRVLMRTRRMKKKSQITIENIFLFWVMVFWY